MGAPDFTPLVYASVAAFGGTLGLLIGLIAWAFGAGTGTVLVIIGGCALLAMIAFKIADGIE